MESNKDEALKCLRIAQKHRDAGNFPSARKFCQKSLTLFATPEAELLKQSIESAAAAAAGSAGPSSSTGTSNGNATSASSSSTETHPSAAGAKRRGDAKAQGTAGGMNGEKREYTAEQVNVVKRVRACKAADYYEILGVKKECEEADIKKAYRKLALALHPDKNGAPGADEAFKMVSKAFQVVSDPQKRAAFDQHGSDPESRFSGMPSPGFSPGFSPSPFAGGFEGEMSPEDLFNMFFGGGGMAMNSGAFGNGPFGGPMFTASFGPGGFRTTRVNVNGRPQAAAQGEPAQARSIFTQLLPLIILFAFSFLSMLPDIFSTPVVPDPRFEFTKTSRFDLERQTNNLHINYYVNSRDFYAHPNIAAELAASQYRRGSALSRFESNIEQVYTQNLYTQCQWDVNKRERRKEAEIGFFGVGTDWEKVKHIEAETFASCEELRRLGLLK
ncbi:DnaJ-domain-containing protein [Imleria badia]|nr:DnaJ-domain-containing protein [Imleria badia]